MDDSILFQPLASEEEKEHINRIRASIDPEFLKERVYSLDTHPDLLGDVRILRVIRGFPDKWEEHYFDVLKARELLGLDEIRDYAKEVIEKKGIMGWDVEDLKYGPEMRPYIPEHRLNIGVHSSGAPISYSDFSVSRLDEFVEKYGYDAFLTSMKSMFELRNLQLSTISTNAFHRAIGVHAFRHDMYFANRNKYAFLFLRSDVCKEMHKCYQEIGGVNYFLDSHWLFSTVYNGLKPLLPYRTQIKNIFTSSSNPLLVEQLPWYVIQAVGAKSNADVKHHAVKPESDPEMKKSENKENEKVETGNKA